jgi:hypothetical protein
MNEIRVTGTGGMIVKVENRNTRQKEYPSAPLCALNIMSSSPAAVRILYEAELLTRFLRFLEKNAAVGTSYLHHF